MALAHSPRIVTDGLVLALDAGNTKSYPGSGTTWTDLSGNGNNGNLVNGVGYTADNGGALSFDAVDDEITFSSYNFGNEITFIFWVKPSATSQIRTLLGAKSPATGNGFAFIINTFNTSDKKLIFEVANGTSATTVQSSINAIPDDTWSQVAVTCVKSTGITHLYSNGMELSYSTSTTLSVTNWSSNTNFKIGQFLPEAGSYHYKGNISNALFYDKALTADEIQQNFNALKGRYGLT